MMSVWTLIFAVVVVVRAAKPSTRKQQDGSHQTVDADAGVGSQFDPVFNGQVAKPAVRRSEKIAVDDRGETDNQAAAIQAISIKEEMFGQFDVDDADDASDLDAANKSSSEETVAMLSEETRQDCTTYMAQTGCGWTSQYNCPGQQSGTHGSASADDSQGYDCCCNQGKWNPHQAGQQDVVNQAIGYNAVGVGACRDANGMAPTNWFKSGMTDGSCRSQCDAEPECAAYNVRPSGGTCQLWGSLLADAPSGWASGLKTGGGVITRGEGSTERGICMKKAQAVPTGYVLTASERICVNRYDQTTAGSPQTVEQCATACDADASCSGFSWNPVTTTSGNQYCVRCKDTTALSTDSDSWNTYAKATKGDNTNHAPPDGADVASEMLQCNVAVTDEERAKCSQYIPCPFLAAAYKYGLLPVKDGQFSFGAAQKAISVFLKKESDGWANQFRDMLFATALAGLTNHFTPFRQGSHSYGNAPMFTWTQLRLHTTHTGIRLPFVADGTMEPQNVCDTNHPDGPARGGVFGSQQCGKPGTHLDVFEAEVQMANANGTDLDAKDNMQHLCDSAKALFYEGERQYKKGTISTFGDISLDACHALYKEGSAALGEQYDNLAVWRELLVNTKLPAGLKLWDPYDHRYVTVSAQGSNLEPAPTCALAIQNGCNNPADGTRCVHGSWRVLSHHATCSHHGLQPVCPDQIDNGLCGNMEWCCK